MSLNATPRRLIPFSKEIWTFLALTVLSIFALISFVDLSPHVDQEFFFSSDDPNYQADKQISRLFTRKDSQIIISVKGDIFSKEYAEKIEHLSDLLTKFDAVSSVKSITHGPRGIRDAAQSHFWKRLLVAENQESTNIIVIVDEKTSRYLIPRIEDLASVMQADNFHIEISGFPYVVELIRRYLVRDLSTFSTMAFVLFGIVIILLFHSWRIFLGVMTTCLESCTLTLIMTHLMKIKIGILTANLATIVFIITLSHLVFLTFNWKHLLHAKIRKTDSSLISQAIHMTWRPSFWSMATTVLGFASLLLVPAKPLRELGIAGSMGTLMAFFVAYTVYPPFLSHKEKTHTPSDRRMKEYYKTGFNIFEKRYRAIITCMIGFIIVTLPSLRYLNTDPSLISYFADDSEITKGLKSIDHSGGSSPLILVLKTQSGETLSSNKVYRQLWHLQKDLEKHPDVGTIISLPTLMAEGKRLPFSFFLVWDWFLDTLEKPQYDRIARSFITPDKKYGLFLFRMNELDRKKSRMEVVDEIQREVRDHHFVPYLMGGIYVLQGQLSKLVASSLIYGLGNLMLLFAAIAFIVSHSFRISWAMTLSIGIIPLCILGGIGILGVPLDTISAPGTNIAISMGIDAMIHMTHAYHRLRLGPGKCKNTGRTWARVRKEMWEPVITSMMIVSSGFAIFFFSSFPPTQRFGGAIVWGTLMSAMSALFIFPALAQREP
jgi:predicted RND superfamily exporter protein